LESKHVAGLPVFLKNRTQKGPALCEHISNDF